MRVTRQGNEDAVAIKAGAASTAGSRATADDEESSRQRPDGLPAWAVLLAALVLALGVRLYLILSAPGLLDGDEALVGLQAQAIATGTAHPLPVFFYGQPYMGSLEAYVAAAIFRVAGSSVTGLRLAPLLSALALVTLTYWLARRTSGKSVANVAVLLAALPPLFIGGWTVKARGGYIEVLAQGEALLLVTHLLLYHADKTPRSRCGGALAGLWGLLTGLILWTNPVGLPYIAACVLWAIGVTIGRASRRAQRPPPSSSVHALGWPRMILALVAGLLVGGGPLWLANLSSGGATFAYMLSGSSNGDGVGAHALPVAGYFFSAVAPKLTGAWSPWSSLNPVPLGAAVLVLYAAATMLFALPDRALRVVFPRRDDDGQGRGLLFLFALIATMLFCVSSFGAGALNPYHWDTASRYALPLAGVTPIVAGFFVARLWERSKAAGSVVLAVLMATTGLGYAALEPAAMFQSELWQKAPPSQAPLATFLEGHGIHDVWLNHWAGYPLMFVTQSKVVTADYNDVVLHGGPNRLPWTLRTVGADPRAAYVLVTGDDAPPLASLLHQRGTNYMQARVGPYLVFYNLSRPVPPSEVAPGIDFGY